MNNNIHTYNNKYIYYSDIIVSYLTNTIYNDLNVAEAFIPSKIVKNPEKRLKWIKKNMDKFCFPISSLYFLMVTDKRIESKEEFINLNFETMQRVTGRPTKLILDFLIAWNILECDYTCQVDVKSYGYKFAPKWLKLWEDGQLKFKRKPTNLNIQSAYIDNFEGSAHILSGFANLNFDTVLANQIKTEYLSTLQDKEPIEKEIYYDFIIDSWKNKDFFLKRSRKTGRIFTLLSSTPRNLRKCIKFGNKNLFICDIKSCQPLLLYSFYEKPSEESLKYKNIVESGLFYKTVINGLKEDFNDKTKEKYKKIIWGWAFDRKVWPETQNIDNYFKSEFPELTKQIKKGKERVSKEEKRPHAKVAVKLQSMESSVMVEKLSSFCKENNILYLTIHDSFLCEKEHINKMIKFVTTQFQQKFDLTPSLDIKENY